MSLTYGLLIEIGILLIIVILVIIYAVSIVKTNEKEDYDSFIFEYENYKKRSLEKLDNGNKYIDNIEKEILDCKKRLGFKLFK